MIYTLIFRRKKAKTGTPTAATANVNATVEADSIIYETDENGNLLRTLTYYPGSSEPVVTTYMEVVDSNGTATSAAIGGSSGGSTYDPDDYYDYSYTSRLRRFHTDVYVGWGYYDPYFTNLYWYDYCPASWGLSIYLGYNWWWPGYYYRPYYYGPCWYSCGFNYGWGWYRPYYDPWYHPYGPYGPHGPAPIDWYHNNHDPNHSYFYGHRNNIGPSVGNGGGNGGRGERPDNEGSNGSIASGYGNGATNNYYSTTPESFNQRYEQIAGTTGGGSSFGNSSNSSTTPTSISNKIITGARTEAPTNLKPADINAQPAASNTTTTPTNVPTGTTATPAKQTTTTVTSGRTNSSTTTTTTTNRPTTVTRTVVTPSNTSISPRQCHPSDWHHDDHTSRNDHGDQNCSYNHPSFQYNDDSAYGVQRILHPCRYFQQSLQLQYTCTQQPSSHHRSLKRESFQP